MIQAPRLIQNSAGVSDRFSFTYPGSVHLSRPRWADFVHLPPLSFSTYACARDVTAGFTLIEMMVVMAIMALMAAVAMPSISSFFNVSLSSTGRQFAGTVKETYNATVVTGQIHRIVYDLKEGSYWVEAGPPSVLLDTKESKERTAKMKRMAFESDKKKDDDTGGFMMDKSVTRKKISLPLGVKFEDIKTQQSDEAITDGKAYTHFFPHGMIEQTIVHIEDTSKHHVSLVITPILGKTDMYDRYINEKEAINGGK